MEATGVILAGGSSSRMKVNKSFVEIEGQPLIEIVLHKLIKAFKETIIITNEPELYQYLGIPVYTDIYPRRGPISGIHAAVHHASFPLVFVQACDMPFMSMDLAKYLVDKIGTYEAAVPSWEEGIEPLAAVYAKSLENKMEQFLIEGKQKTTKAVKSLNYLPVYTGELQQFGNPRRMFYNINDPLALHEVRLKLDA